MTRPCRGRTAGRARPPPHDCGYGGARWTRINRCWSISSRPIARGHHPAAFLQGWQGYLQADAYSGYDALFADGKIIEVGCFAHARRRYFEIAKNAKTPGFAHEMLERIRELYAIE